MDVHLLESEDMSPQSLMEKTTELARLEERATRATVALSNEAIFLEQTHFRRDFEC